MPVQFFGQYLLIKKIVTREELLAAVAFQESQNLKLGEYAVLRGYMTDEQAEMVNRRQQTKDERFGDAAIALGLLSPAQVDELITIQRNNHIYLGDAIVRKGFADQTTVDEALRNFQAEQRQYDTKGVDLKDFKVPQEEIFSTCFELTQKLLLRMWDVQAKLGKPITKTGTITLKGHVVQISFSGNFNTRYILAASSPVIARGAKKTIKEEEPDTETCDDLLREFANITCGNIVALLAKQGKSCDIAPPTTIGTDIELGPAKAIVMPIVTPDGDAVLILTFP